MRIALICSKNPPGDAEANLRHHKSWVQRALAEKPRLIVFPECSLTGYKLDPAVALTLESPEVKALCELARAREVFICAGLVEAREGNFFNTQFLAGPDGLIGVMRKVCLTTPERNFFSPGRDFPVFDVEGAPVGILICADATHYEPVRVLALRGAQIIVVPHATYLKGTPASWFAWRAERWPLFAQDCGAYLAGCNNAGLSETPTPGEQDLKFASGTIIIGPNGRTLARTAAERNIETMLAADLPLGEIESRRRKLVSYTDVDARLFYGGLMDGSPYAPPETG